MLKWAILAMALDLFGAFVLPAGALVAIVYGRWDIATFFMVVATNLEVGYWGRRMVGHV